MDKNGHFLWIDERKIPIAQVKAFAIYRGERMLAGDEESC